jgi:hypothetical protein
MPVGRTNRRAWLLQIHGALQAWGRPARQWGQSSPGSEIVFSYQPVARCDLVALKPHLDERHTSGSYHESSLRP